MNIERNVLAALAGPIASNMLTSGHRAARYHLWIVTLHKAAHAAVTTALGIRIEEVSILQLSPAAPAGVNPAATCAACATAPAIWSVPTSTPSTASPKPSAPGMNSPAKKPNRSSPPTAPNWPKRPLGPSWRPFPAGSPIPSFPQPLRPESG